MSETLTIFGTQFTGVTGIKATDSSNQIKTYIIPQGNISITNNGNNIDVTNYATASVSVGSGLPTQHTVHFDFADTSDADISAYYSNSLIGTMITNYTPTTYNNKTVDTAELDGVEWYARPSITWTTILDGNRTFTEEPGEGDSYTYITELAGYQITENSIWRITFGNTTRIHTAIYGPVYPGASASDWHIDGINDGTNSGYTIWGDNTVWLIADYIDTSTHAQYVKIEQGTTSS